MDTFAYMFLLKLYVIFFSGQLCFNTEACTHWTWIDELEGHEYASGRCHLKTASSGYSYLEGVVSGGQDCTKCK